MIMMDIVLQGQFSPTTDLVIDSYLDLPFVNNIIVSCWKTDQLSTLVYTNPRVLVVLNDPPLQRGTDNRNLQIVTSLNGLRKVSTTVSAKMRNDQIYTRDSMIKMYEFFLDRQQPNQLFVAGMYPNLLFSPRDHVFWGETASIIKLFDIPLEYNGVGDRVKIDKWSLAKYYSYFIRTETYICANYCSEFDERIKLMLIQPEKYLYDHAVNWQESYDISKVIMPKLFKSFPRTGIDLAWPKNGWPNYPYQDQSQYYQESWHEDGY
jgi:hypothetical protein